MALRLGGSLRGWLWCSLVAGSLGCGYQLAASGRLPNGVRSVDVPLARNATTEPGLDGELTDGVRHRLAELGAASSADGNERATLELALVSAGGGPLAPKVAPLASAGYNAAAAPGIYAVSASVAARLVQGEKVLWQDTISWTERYLPSDDLANLEARRREAIARLVRSLAQEICARLAVAG